MSVVYEIRQLNGEAIKSERRIYLMNKKFELEKPTDEQLNVESKTFVDDLIRVIKENSGPPYTISRSRISDGYATYLISVNYRRFFPLNKFCGPYSTEDLESMNLRKKVKSDYYKYNRDLDRLFETVDSFNLLPPVRGEVEEELSVIDIDIRRKLSIRELLRFLKRDGYDLAHWGAIVSLMELKKEELAPSIAYDLFIGNCLVSTTNAWLMPYVKLSRGYGRNVISDLGARVIDPSLPPCGTTRFIARKIR